MFKPNHEQGDGTQERVLNEYALNEILKRNYKVVPENFKIAIDRIRD